MRKIGRKHIRSVTREIGKAARSVLHDVLLPEGKTALRKEIQNARRRHDFNVETPIAEAIVEDAIDGKGLYAGARGGALGGAVRLAPGFQRVHRRMLTNVQIEDLAKRMQIPLEFCDFKNNLPKKIKTNCSYIIN